MQEKHGHTPKARCFLMRPEQHILREKPRQRKQRKTESAGESE